MKGTYLTVHDNSTVATLNTLLPSDIRIQAIKKVTKNFNSKTSCCGRTYLYLTPTFAFSPVEKVVTEEYRIEPQTLDLVNKVLAKFVGPHYFHNYTSGK